MVGIIMHQGHVHCENLATSRVVAKLSQVNSYKEFYVKKRGKILEEYNV